MKTKLHIRQSLHVAAATLAIFLFNGMRAQGQTTPTPAGAALNVADVNAMFYSDGISFMNPDLNSTNYTVPKTGNVNSIFAASMWIGGLDVGGNLHTAAGTYRQNGVDFWPGPIMNKANYSSHQDSLWNKVWTIYKSTIDSFRRGEFKHVPASIANWPANGDVSLGEAPQLAPYVDSNHNGYYDPANGDYPLIRGDQAVYMIFNDDRGTHKETGGAELGIEVHLMAYAYNTPSDTAVYQTTFLHYDIFNYSANTYHNVYLGYFCDMDLGNGSDDFVGSDSAHSFWYTYNGEPTDPNGTGQFANQLGYGGPTPPPPAQGVAYLCDTMSHFMYYDNDYSVTGNPTSDLGYYNYMQDIWTDGSHLTYGGTGYQSSAVNTNYMFSGNPATGAGWSEVSAHDAFGDRRGLSSEGPFTFNPGGTDKSLDIALVFARAKTGNQNTSVTTLGTAVQNVKDFYANQGYECDKTLTGINEVKQASLATATLYPNPFNTSATLSVTSDKELTNAELQVYDMLGRQVYSQDNIHTNNITIEKGSMQTGLYFYRLSEAGQPLVDGKFMVQ